MHIPNTGNHQIFSRKNNIDAHIKYLDQQLEKIFNQSTDLLFDTEEFVKYLENGWDQEHYEDISISDTTGRTGVTTNNKIDASLDVSMLKASIGYKF